MFEKSFLGAWHRHLSIKNLWWDMLCHVTSSLSIFFEANTEMVFLKESCFLHLQ